jgi:CRISPR-associated protein Cas1
MKFLALLSDNINLRKQGERVIFETRTKRVSLLLNNIYGILVFGRVHISGDALNFILSRDIPVFFLTRFGRLKCILYTETLTSNYNNRLSQYEAHIHKRVEIARFLVREKIESIETFFGINLDAEKLLLEEAESVDQIMGIEGIASKKMFDRVKELLREAPLPFEERSYYPPKDEVNALLSLAYTMVYLTAIPVVVALGYDPYVSFLHSKRGTHAAFCSDIMESIRPFITRELVYEIKRGTFKVEDFQKTQKGIYLKDEALDKFLNFYEGKLNEVLDRLKENLLKFSEKLE